MRKLDSAPTLRRTAISVAVGMCLVGLVHAQAVEGSINGTAKAGATVTLTAPGGAIDPGQGSGRTVPSRSRRWRRAPTRCTSDGVTRDVVVAAGVGARVALDAAAMEKITVTGSRIARDTFNSTSPVLVITRDETMMSGFNSTTAALQGTGVTAGGAQINNAFGGFVTDGGPGANTISLRGLGATRTLVLLNGRRVAPAGTRGSVGSADLNVFPTAVVDRIEVLKDGASSIYGSDAVAGVINVITKKNITGVTARGPVQRSGKRRRRGDARVGHLRLRRRQGLFQRLARVVRPQGPQVGRPRLDGLPDRLPPERAPTAFPAPGAAPTSSTRAPASPSATASRGTGNNGVTINTLGTGNRRRRRRAGLGRHDVQPLAPELVRHHGPRGLRGRGRRRQQPQRPRHVRPADVEQQPRSRRPGWPRGSSRAGTTPACWATRSSTSRRSSAAASPRRPATASSRSTTRAAAR